MWIFFIIIIRLLKYIIIIRHAFLFLQQTKDKFAFSIASILFVIIPIHRIACEVLYKVCTQLHDSIPMSCCYPRWFVKLRLAANYRRAVAYIAHNNIRRRWSKGIRDFVNCTAFVHHSFTVIKKKTRECSRPQFLHGARLSREMSEANREL